MNESRKFRNLPCNANNAYYKHSKPGRVCELNYSKLWAQVDAGVVFVGFKISLLPEYGLSW